jgi:7-cyano-7-deazaguanine synthase
LTRVIVLFSGGVDSTLALAWALRQGHEVTTLQFEFPERPAAERGAAQDVLRALRPQHQLTLQLPFPLRPRPPAKEGYLSARNLLFHAIAQSLAESSGAKFVVAGHLERDGLSFPDAKHDYFRAIEALAAKGRPGRRRNRILNPLAGKDRDERMALARRLKAPVDLTWSCWYDGEAPCGVCEKCEERLRLLRAAHPPLAASRPRTGRRPPRGSRASRP